MDGARGNCRNKGQTNMTTTKDNETAPKLRAYEIRFTGRKVGAIGICYEITASRFAVSPDEAVRLLYEPMPAAFEHITNAEAKQVESPFGADGLVLFMRNDRGFSEEFAHLASLATSYVSRAARRCAKTNADWHDDPEDAAHGFFHAPVEAQYPAGEQLVAAAEMLLYFLRETPAGLEICDELQLREGGAK
jgi:hypothetical protein